MGLCAQQEVSGEVAVVTRVHAKEVADWRTAVTGSAHVSPERPAHERQPAVAEGVLAARTALTEEHARHRDEGRAVAQHQAKEPVPVLRVDERLVELADGLTNGGPDHDGADLLPNPQHVVERVKDRRKIRIAKGHKAPVGGLPRSEGWPGIG